MPFRPTLSLRPLSALLGAGAVVVMSATFAKAQIAESGVASNTTLRQSQSDFATGLVDPVSQREAIDRQLRALGRSRSDLSPEERIQLRRLENQSAALGSTSEAGYSSPDPTEAPDEAEDETTGGPGRRNGGFDLFAGPGGEPPANDPSGRARPVAPSRSAPGATNPLGRAASDRLPLLRGAATDLSSDNPADRYTLRRGPSEPIDPIAREPERQPAAGDVNPPLQAGVAGETLGAGSLLRTNRPALAVERILRPEASSDSPFAATGIRAGNFVLYPELSQRFGASSNLQEEPGGSSGAFSETELSLRLLSDWSRHESEINGRLTYRRNFSGEPVDRPEAALDGRLRLDIDRLSSATLRGALRYRRDDNDRPGIAFDPVTQEDSDVLSASVAAEYTREIGRLRLTGTGTIAREAYLTQGTGLPDESYTTTTATLRAGYQVSPAFQPFVEASAGRRFFDEARIGPDGIERDTVIPSLRAGVTIDIEEKLRGEVALGYAWSLPDDGRAKDTASPTLDANLTWSPQRGRDVILSTRTTFQPETTGLSATATYDASLGFLHVLNSQVDLNGALVAKLEDSSLANADEWELGGEFGFTYWLNRTLSFTGLYAYRDHGADQASETWDAHTVSLGIRLRR
ncbi:hypothetical protein SAMN06297251_13012 [Fulvimarina manganoxydans]|uniref:Outer membrane beta-barrel protein n=2 Tax=Fulvimarina manganoxydans TaxID=937218 RepID=A0A1W2ER93_9HYPH|nr:hypothetical protein SAMN06297251_13012 [Fulvimarina manganoxydans]